MPWTREDVYLVAERASQLSRQGRYRESAILLEGLVAVAPADSYCRNALARVYLALGLPDRALDLYTGTLDAEAREVRTEALLQLNRRDEAVKELHWLATYSPGPRFRRLRILAESSFPAPSSNFG